MMTAIKIVEWVMYGLGAFGIGGALFGIYSVCLAFARKQDRLFQQRSQEFLLQKSRVEKHLSDKRPI